MLIGQMFRPVAASRDRDEVIGAEPGDSGKIVFPVQPLGLPGCIEGTAVGYDHAAGFDEFGFVWIDEEDAAGGRGKHEVTGADGV